MSSSHHPPVGNNGGATIDHLLRNLWLFFSLDLREKFEFPALEVCLSEVRVRSASSGLYFLNDGDLLELTTDGY